MQAVLTRKRSGCSASATSVEGSTFTVRRRLLRRCRDLLEGAVKDGRRIGKLAIMGAQNIYTHVPKPPLRLVPPGASRSAIGKRAWNDVARERFGEPRTDVEESE
jgi:hypothetical protein